jgi:hypothetical protein
VSDFKVSSEQRQRLLDEKYAPLEFDIKPTECVPGAEYVLSWAPASAVVCEDGHVIRTPRRPVWFLTVTSCKRILKGHRFVWDVRFRVTDLRDPDLWLRRGGGYQTTPHEAVDVLPVAPSDVVRAKAISEGWHQRRLAKFAEEQRERGRARSRARRRRAA